MQMIVVKFSFERSVYIREMRKKVYEGIVKFFSELFRDGY